MTASASSCSPLSNSTTRTAPSLTRIVFTFTFVRTCTPNFLISWINVSKIVLAESVTGNILPWSSSFNRTPRLSKNWIISWLSNCEKALYKKRPFPGMCFTISSGVRRFVTLQRVPPVCNNFFPSVGFFSSNTTSAPCIAALTDAINPLVPPPITITFILASNFLYPNHYKACKIKKPRETL